MHQMRRDAKQRAQLEPEPDPPKTARPSRCEWALKASITVRASLATISVE